MELFLVSFLLYSKGGTWLLSLFPIICSSSTPTTTIMITSTISLIIKFYGQSLKKFFTQNFFFQNFFSNECSQKLNSKRQSHRASSLSSWMSRSRIISITHSNSRDQHFVVGLEKSHVCSGAGVESFCRQTRSQLETPCPHVMTDRLGTN